MQVMQLEKKLLKMNFKDGFHTFYVCFFLVVKGFGHAGSLFALKAPVRHI